MPDVRDDLIEADLVIPSLDAVSAHVFNTINRPHKEITVEKVIEGIISFRKEFPGKIWLEVMVIKGVNDRRDELQRIKEVIRDCGADRIQINSLVRPAPDVKIEPAERAMLMFAKKIFGEKSEIIGGFTRDIVSSPLDNVCETIIDLTKRRPCSLEQISQSTGISKAVVIKYIEMMLSDDLLKEVLYSNDTYYSASKKVKT